MVIVKPFHGITYNKKLIKNLSSVFCPSYDQIYDQNRSIYLRDNDYNIVRVLSGPEFPGDNEKNNRYSRAGKFFRKWLKEGVLVKDKEPCMYLYEQTYTIRRGEPKTRRGFIALTRLEDYDRNFIRPHEQTFQRSTGTVLRLIREIKANISPVFCVYPRSDKIHEIIKKTEVQKPMLEFFDRKNFIEKVWRIDEVNYIKIIEHEMKHRNAYVADGHHRFEALRIYRDYCKAKMKTTKDLPCDFILTLFVEDASPGLSILPTYRLIKNMKDFSHEYLATTLRKFFDVQQYRKMDGRAVFLEMRSNYLKHAFAIYYKERFYYLTLKDGKMMEKYGDKKASRTWNLLDVNVLNRLILEKVLGLKRKDIENGIGILYTRWIDTAIKSVEDGENKIAIFLNGTKIKQVIKVADNSEKMPQKSTHFYPKPLTGVVMYDIC